MRVTSKKLRSYFQAHQVSVLSNVPLQVILHRFELSGWLVKWVVELSEFGMQYLPHLSLKGQVLPYFIMEWLDFEDHLDQELMEWWILYLMEHHAA